MRTIPPKIPIKNFTDGSPATVINPRAKSMIKENSTTVCAIEKIKPLLAPVFDPCVIVSKNRGPGARAPDAVINTTVVTKLRISII
jgi:hypothetical protein